MRQPQSFERDRKADVSRSLPGRAAICDNDGWWDRQTMGRKCQFGALLINKLRIAVYAGQEHRLGGRRHWARHHIESFEPMVQPVNGTNAMVHQGFCGLLRQKFCQARHHRKGPSSAPRGLNRGLRDALPVAGVA